MSACERCGCLESDHSTEPTGARAYCFNCRCDRYILPTRVAVAPAPDPRDAEIARLTSRLERAEASIVDRDATIASLTADAVRDADALHAVLVAQPPQYNAITRLTADRARAEREAQVAHAAAVQLAAERDAAIAILTAASGEAHHEGTLATGLVGLAREVAAGVSMLDEEATRMDGWAVTAMRAAKAWKSLARKLRAELADAERHAAISAAAGTHTDESRALGVDLGLNETGHTVDSVARRARAELARLRAGIAALAVEVDAVVLAAFPLVPAMDDAFQARRREAVERAMRAVRATFARLDPQTGEALPADDPSRCAVCSWPLHERAADGCVRGLCSQRPPPQNTYAPGRAARERADAERKGAEVCACGHPRIGHVVDGYCLAGRPCVCPGFHTDTKAGTP